MANAPTALDCALYYAKKRRKQRAAKIVGAGAMSVEEGAANGTVVGRLVMQPQFGRTTYTLTDDAGGRFALDGNAIVVADDALLVFANDESHDISVSAVDPSGNAFTATLSIEVTEAP